VIGAGKLWRRAVVPVAARQDRV